MSGPSTSSERSTVNTNSHLQSHHDTTSSAVVRQPDYQSATATAAAAVSASVYANGAHPDEANQFHHHPQHSYSPASAAAAAAAAAQLQHHQQQQLQQQQLQQQHLQQQQHQLHQHQLQQLQQQQMHHRQQQHHAPPQLPQAPPTDYEAAGILHSKYMENEIIKTFSSKPELVKYVKSVLNDEEQCKIVINSSKPKAVYFQCERSGSFRTTVKDSTKRQRVAYTKRNKCGYRLVANLYPPEKDKKKLKKPGTPDGTDLDRNLDDKLNEFQPHPGSLTHPQSQSPSVLNTTSNEMWILRMINPAHNHPPEPPSNKKKRSKYSRTLVEKPLNRNNSSNNTNAFNSNDIVNQLPHHPHHPQVQHLHQHHEDPTQHTPSVQDVAVIAAIEATPAAAAAVVALHSQHPPVDPNIDPNVDPSVQEHDHSHGTLR